MRIFLIISLLLVVTSKAIDEPDDPNPEIGIIFKKAECGDKVAQRQLGEIYQQGKIVLQDSDRSTSWYKKAAENGDSEGQYIYGSKLLNDTNCVQNQTLGFDYLYKSAFQGSAQAMWLVGMAYRDGKGVICDLRESLAWIDLAEKRDFCVGNILYIQDALGPIGCEAAQKRCAELDAVIPVNLESKAQMVKIYASTGNPNAEAYMASAYESGYGINKNPKKALFWMNLAAEHGNKFAQATLGIKYAKGDSVPKDMNKAFYWYKKSAMQGNSDAQSLLADCYFCGEGTLKDEIEGLAWCYLSSAQGDELSKKQVLDFESSMDHSTKIKAQSRAKELVSQIKNTND